MDTVTYLRREADRARQRLDDLNDVIEGLEAKPEPVQSVVSVAGGDITPSESGVSAGREPCSLEGFEAWIDRRIEDRRRSFPCDSVFTGDPFYDLMNLKGFIAAYRSTAA